MQIQLTKYISSPDLALPENMQGETITWNWNGGNTQLQIRNDKGAFDNWLAYDILLVKLQEWDQRDIPGEQSIRTATITLDIDPQATYQDMINKKNRQEDYSIKINLDDKSNYQKWIDLLPLIDYLIDNEPDIFNRIKEAREDIQDIRSLLYKDLINLSI